MIPDATGIAHLAPHQRAEFTVTTRLFSCLVTESLLHALYFPLSGSSATGFALILLRDPSKASVSPNASTSQITDVFALIPLRGTPILTDDDGGSTIRKIALLHSLDMDPLPLVISKYDQSHYQETGNGVALNMAILNTLNTHGWFTQTKKQLEPCSDPALFWRSYARYANLTDSLTEEIAQEFTNSVKWQAYSYRRPPEAPSFDSSSIEWEQSVVEGHPLHPMHKMRYFLPPLPNYAPGTCDLYHVKLRLVSAPKSQLEITNDFEKYIEPIIKIASLNAGTELKVAADHLILPVLEMQIAHIQDKFPDLEVLPSEFATPALAQLSIRTVQVPDASDKFSLKLALGLQLTQAIRLVYPEDAYLGPRFSAQVVPHLKLDPNVVIVAKELASVVHTHPDPDIAGHCGAIIREAHEINSEERGERVIVCNALVESGHAGEGGHLPAVIRIFQLDTVEKRRNWFDRFVRLFFEAFLPPLIHNGVAFECHPQNCLARFDLKTKELRGFIVRDFGAIGVHPETLYATTGVELDCLPGHSVAVHDLDKIYSGVYHAGIHNHLQRLIRVLDLHYNGEGWEIVRQHLMQLIPKDHGLYKAWLSSERKMVKCLLRMRIEKVDKYSLYTPVPNLIIHNFRTDADLSRHP